MRLSACLRGGRIPGLLWSYQRDQCVSNASWATSTTASPLSGVSETSSRAGSKTLEQLLVCLGESAKRAREARLPVGAPCSRSTSTNSLKTSLSACCAVSSKRVVGGFSALSDSALYTAKTVVGGVREPGVRLAGSVQLGQGKGRGAPVPRVHYRYRAGGDLLNRPQSSSPLQPPDR